MTGELCACVHVSVAFASISPLHFISIIATISFVSRYILRFCMVIFFYGLAQLFKTDGCILTVLDKTRMLLLLLHRMHPVHMSKSSSSTSTRLCNSWAPWVRTRRVTITMMMMLMVVRVLKWMPLPLGIYENILISAVYSWQIMTFYDMLIIITLSAACHIQMANEFFHQQYWTCRSISAFSPLHIYSSCTRGTSAILLIFSTLNLSLLENLFHFVLLPTCQTIRMARGKNRAIK